MQTPTGLPVGVEVHGNPDARSESVVSFESGYRVELGDFTLDATAFTSRFGSLRTTEPRAPFLSMESGGPAIVIPLVYDYRMGADSRGVEFSADWHPVPFWRLEAGYTAFHLTSQVHAGSQDQKMAVYEGVAPRQQWQARSSMSLPARIEMDALLFHSGAIRGLPVPAYTRADLRVQFAATRQVSLVVVGQNLLDSSHLEFTGGAEQVLATRQPRAGRVQLVWKF
jgi:iron complex outermembrane receptor protein